MVLLLYIVLILGSLRSIAGQNGTLSHSELYNGEIEELRSQIFAEMSLNANLQTQVTNLYLTLHVIPRTIFGRQINPYHLSRDIACHSRHK